MENGKKARDMKKKIIGALLGKGAIPREFLEQLELRAFIEGKGKMLQSVRK